MWFDEAGEVVEMFRSSFPLSFLFFVPILIIISPVSPVGAAHEFAAFRMQHYDLQGSAYGCRNALVNVEAHPIDAKVLTRRCVIAKLKEVTLDKYRDMMLQNAGALLILLPQRLAELSATDREHLLDLEQELMQEETQMPVYFAHEDEETMDIYDQVKAGLYSEQAGSAAEALLTSAYANGFQMVINGAQSKALTDFQLVNIHGKLAGYGIEEQLPTIVLVAHYDAYGVAPSLATGSDSNASGVVMLLELARLFSKLYTNSRTHAKFNLVFLLSAGGKYNYQGTKRWIEDQIDSAEISLLSDVAYVLCLDSLAQGEVLNLHVSKPPKEGSAGDILYKNLQNVSREFYPDSNMGIVHKKINLADDFLAWEHERFSIRRMLAFTLSHFDSHSQSARSSILDTRELASTEVLARNVKIAAEAIARHIFTLSGQESLEIFTEGMKVEEEVLAAWLDHLSSESRAAQLMGKDSGMVATLEQAMARYLKDVKRHTFKADKRDPEFVFYGGNEFTMNAYNVKPAVFDLFLALAIAGYLALLYFLVQNFPMLYAVMRKLASPTKAKKQ